MAHKKIIDSVKKQGQVAIKDLDEFLRFVINESDMRTYDDNYISILIPMKAVSRIESGRKVLWKNPIFEETKK